MRHLASKICAAALSAAVILVWWPHLFAADSIKSWFWRGAVWTLSFEVLLLTLAPLEDVLWDHTRAGQALRSRGERLRERVAHPTPHKQALRLGLLAACVLALPLGLLVRGAGQPLKQQAAVVRVEKVTRIVRPVKVERIVMRRVVVERVAASEDSGTSRRVSAPSPAPLRLRHGAPAASTPAAAPKALAEEPLPVQVPGKAPRVEVPASAPQVEVPASAPQANAPTAAAPAASAPASAAGGEQQPIVPASAAGTS